MTRQSGHNTACTSKHVPLIAIISLCFNRSSLHNQFLIHKRATRSVHSITLRGYATNLYSKRIIFTCKYPIFNVPFNVRHCTILTGKFSTFYLSLALSPLSWISVTSKLKTAILWLESRARSGCSPSTYAHKTLASRVTARTRCTVGRIQI